MHELPYHSFEQLITFDAAYTRSQSFFHLFFFFSFSPFSFRFFLHAFHDMLLAACCGIVCTRSRLNVHFEAANNNNNNVQPKSEYYFFLFSDRTRSLLTPYTLAPAIFVAVCSMSVGGRRRRRRCSRHRQFHTLRQNLNSSTYSHTPRTSIAHQASGWAYDISSVRK